MSDSPRGRISAACLACCLTALFVCAGNAVLLGVGNGTNTITGKVSGPGGKFLENIEVRLQSESGIPADSVYTDEQGQFVFQGVRDGSFHVIVSDARYQPVDVLTHVNSQIDPLQHVFIALRLRDGSTSSTPPFSSGSQTVSVNELRKRYPEKAVKEYTRGNAKMSRGDLKAAIAAFEKAVALAPEMYPALGNLGNAYLKSGRLPDAESAFQRALKANPGSAESYVNLGHVYFEMHKYKEAAEALSRGVEQDPNNALGHFFLGMTDIRMGRTREAEKSLSRALALNEPEVADAHLALANLYLKTHRVPQAREQLEGFLRVRPQDAQANHVRDVLARLKAEALQ